MDSASIRRDLVRGAAGTSAVRITSTGLGLVVTAMLARLLGAEGYGIYVYALALVTLLAVPATVGPAQMVIVETALLV